jgi:hypothetical protein
MSIFLLLSLAILCLHFPSAFTEIRRYIIYVVYFHFDSLCALILTAQVIYLLSWSLKSNTHNKLRVYFSDVSQVPSKVSLIEDGLRKLAEDET